MQELRAKLEATHIRRLALDHYEFARAGLLEYERRMRPTLAGLDGLRSVLEYIRDMKTMQFDRVETAIARLTRFMTTVDAITPPDDLAGIHATFVSAVRMARDACERRRLAVVTNKIQTDREASSAAAGALLLTEEGKRGLVASLYPPR